MKKIITAFIAFVCLLAVLVIALGIYVATLDPNDYKDMITERVQEETGRRLSLNGDISMTLYPWLGLEVNDVTFSNPSGFGDEPFAHVDYAQIRLKTIPIFQKQYEIDTVKVHGAVFNLVKNKNNVTNWQDLAGEKKESEPLPLNSIVIGGVDIQDGRLTWTDEVTGARYEISDLDVETGELVYGQPIELNLNLLANSNQPAISGDLALTGTVAYDSDNESVSIKPLEIISNLSGQNIPGGRDRLTYTSGVDLDLKAGTASITDIALNVLGMQAAGEVLAKNIKSPAPAVTATLDVNGTDLSLLFKAAEIEPLATQIAELRDRSFIVKTRLDADLDRGDVNIPEINAEMLGASIKGQVKAQNVRSDSPSFSGELNASGPDLPTLMQVAGQFQPGEEPVLEKYGRQLAAIPARQKAFSAEAWFDADLKSGNIEVPTLSLNALGVTVAGKLKARQMQDKNGSVEGNLEVTGRDMARVLAAVDQKPLSEVLQEFNLQTSVAGNRTSLNLKPLVLTASFAGEKIPNSPVKVAVNADTRVNLEAEELNLDNFTVQGLGLNVRGNLAARDIKDSARFQGQVKVDDFNLRRLMNQLNMELPVTADNKTLRKVAYNSKFSGSKTNLEIRDMVVILDDSTLNGDLSVKNFEKPATQFNLNIDAINADRYLPPPEEGKKQQKTAQAESDLPVETIRSLNTNGKVKIGELIISKARLENISLTLTGKDGVLKLDPASADLYQGRYTGDITLNAKDKLPRLTINSALKNIQIEPLITDMTGKRKLRGTGNFSAALFSVGRDTGAIKQNLNGQMNFSFKDGALIGFNLGKIMRMGNQLKNTMSLKVSEHEETDFTEITGNPVVTNGIVTLDDLNGKSPALRLSGKGILTDLNTNTLDYTVTAQILATAKGQGGRELDTEKLEGVPLDCRFSGSTDSPQRKCDASKLIAALGMKVIKGITELPGKITGGGEAGTEGEGSTLGNILNAIPISGQDSENQTDQQTETQTTETTKDEEVDETIKKAGEALKGLFGR